MIYRVNNYTRKYYKTINIYTFVSTLLSNLRNNLFDQNSPFHSVNTHTLSDIATYRLNQPRAQFAFIYALFYSNNKLLILVIFYFES